MNKFKTLIIASTALMCCTSALTGCKSNNSNNSKSYNYTYMNKKETKMYDTSGISNAYLSGDSYKLSQTDKEILEKAAEILDKITNDKMSDYEKELAVHDYLVSYATYDEKALGALGGPNTNSDNPYGTLINGKAICSGYTTTFQMFMDMLKIPCKTILAEDEDGDDHAWNMVELDGDWYYVDVTWDDPIPDHENRPVSHKYFNVTEKFLRANRHCWDSSDLPKADSTKYAYKEKQE